MDLRTLIKSELKAVNNGEYIVSVDVARSESTANNQCSVAVLKIKRNSSGKISVVQLVNLINIPSILNFQAQAQEVMKVKNLYNAKAVIVDGNGLGAGLVDALTLEQVDPSTGDILGCYKTMNTEQESETEDAEEILYELKAQGINHDIIVTFIDYIEGGKLQLLEKRNDVNYDISNTDYFVDKTLPFIQTDQLLEEIANLKLKTLGNGKLSIEQQARKINKDRFSALSYGLWYIKTFEDNYEEDNSANSIADYLFIN